MSITTDSKQAEKGNVARMIDRLSKDVSSSANLSSSKDPSFLKKAKINKTTVVARFSYAPMQEDELELCEDDQLEVIEDVEDGWAKGKIICSSKASSIGKIGMYPTNFVSQVDSSLSQNSSMSLATANRLENEDSEKRNGSVSLSESMTTEGSVLHTSNILPSAIKSRRAVSSVVLGANDHIVASSTPHHHSKQKYEHAQVLFNYDAAHPDELSLPEGAIVTVINKNCEDEGWYDGEYDGRRGLFPENFVKLIPITPPVSDKLPSPIGPPTLPAKPAKHFSIPTPPVMPGSPPKPLENSNNSLNSLTQLRDSSIDGRSKSEIKAHINSSLKAGSATNSSQNPPSSLEVRKSIVAGIQSKLFPSGKLPPQRPPQPSIPVNSPATTEFTVEPKVVFSDDPSSGKLPSLLKSRAAGPNNKRPPSKLGLINTLSKSPTFPAEPISSDNIMVNQNLTEISPTTVSPRKSPNTLLETKIKFEVYDNLDTKSYVKSTEQDSHYSGNIIKHETEFITMEKFLDFKNEVDRKFAELHQLIEGLKNQKEYQKK